MLNNPPATAAVSDLLLTEIEAARCLKVSPSTLYRLRKSGKVGYVQTGEVGVRYEPVQIQAYIAANRKDAEHG